MWDFFRSGLISLNNFKTQHKIDVVVSMWAIPGGFFAKKLKDKFNIPYIIWLLGSDLYVYGKIPVIKTILVEALKKADVLYADGKDLSIQVKNLVSKDCSFLPSVSGFNSIDLKPKAEEKIVLTFLGRFEKVKGPDILLDALILLKNKLQNHKINFIGTGQLLLKLKEKTAKANLHKIIHFYGNIDSKKRIQNIVSSSNWLVIPSRSDSIPLVFSESMKCRTPVIVSDLPDLKFLVDKYNVGYVFKTGNIYQLANLLELLPNKKTEERRFSKNTAKLDDLFNVRTSTDTLKETILKINSI